MSSPIPPALPKAWISYRTVRSLEEDIDDLLAHGVGNISWRVNTAEAEREILEVCRRKGMTLHIEITEITEHGDRVSACGLEPEWAIMIGGAYRGLAIDRHLFSFAPSKHEIIIEPPVYSEKLPYFRRQYSDPEPDLSQPVGHYYPDMGTPLRAEVVVPLKPFDGQQHLAIVPASIEPAPGAAPEVDSVPEGLPPSKEIDERMLYTLSFDLSGLDTAMLDQVGLAVYWPYQGTDQYWIFGTGTVSANAESTREALRRVTRDVLNTWTKANDGTFPHDVVRGVRFGDECFYITGHTHAGTPSVSYPLWDFSGPLIQRFESETDGLAYPRTWGFPGIYGEQAYAQWMELTHRSCAELCAIVREEIASLAPALPLFRNTTRMGIFDLCNEHDGTGQELLTQNLDLVHLDPYPVLAHGYEPLIPRDVSYCAGLARRYGRPLMPWMQAHIYGGADGIQHVTPADVDRMCEEQWAQGVDAVMWLGYGPKHTFPDINRESWEHAAAFHRRLEASPPAKPEAELGVIRPYRVRALSSLCGDRIRNPADWLLQQFLEVWAVKHGKPYDVFELPPPGDCLAVMSKYRYVVSTIPYPDGWIIGEDAPEEIPLAEAKRYQEQFEAELKTRGWLAGA